MFRFDGARLRVGPESAGASPGPASYRRGGPLTVTDANVLLGRIQPRFFPRVFGPAANESLDEKVVVHRFGELAQRIASTTGRAVAPEEVAGGALRIAVGAMANAVKRISVMRGHDVSAYTLQCFGGAGGQHAALVADLLGMSRIFIHPFAGVLSAYGMGLADQIAMREAALERELNLEGLSAAAALAARLLDEAAAELKAQGLAGDALARIARLHVRYQGTDTALPCALPPTPQPEGVAGVRDEFERSYRRRYEFVMPGQAMVIEAVSVECIAPGAEAPGVDAPAGEQLDAGAAYEPAASAEISMYCLADALPAGWRQARLYQAHELHPGARIAGPAILADSNATTVVEPGWEAQGVAGGCIELRRVERRRGEHALGTHADPIVLELFNNIFMNIAEQMGLRLQNTAYSVNIKERLDFSCALFDARRIADRQRAAHAGAFGFHERVDSHASSTAIRRCAAAMSMY